MYLKSVLGASSQCNIKFCPQKQWNAHSILRRSVEELFTSALLIGCALTVATWLLNVCGCPFAAAPWLLSPGECSMTDAPWQGWCIQHMLPLGSTWAIALRCSWTQTCNRGLSGIALVLRHSPFCDKIFILPIEVGKRIYSILQRTVWEIVYV